MTRLLAGDGGDEVFGGNERYARDRVFGAYHRIPAVLRRGLLEPVVDRLPEEAPADSWGGPSGTCGGLA